ncbi:beta-1,3-galactosyltransferase 2-like isoform X2 [Dunckerocampus dactyliophorus]|uniref:beta-1,3-galactosyltransferase 2-like isoform X2 n=1 Tax=Dunckerocampus dactyliophorus TaxID=161453 RepID=UPI002404AFBE|nr:beta-1,3-galactosyltransferase 2-like isoform X2 [Dunckerocampus dactyliophorus]
MDNSFHREENMDMEESCERQAVPHRRGCGGRRRHSFFFILAVSVLLFFCSRNMEDVASDWRPTFWMQYMATKWWTRLKTEAFLNVSTNNLFGVTSETSPVSQSPYIVAYPHEYHFIINEPKKCEDQKSFVVLMVPVAPHNRRQRDIIRRTWGGNRVVLGKVVTVLFLLGLHTGEPVPHMEEHLQQESIEHQDLIQSSFQDCYNNLTIKTMVMLEWLNFYCSEVSYAMKIDSDIFLNVPNLITMLLNAQKTNYMTGLVAREAAVLRDHTSKWYLPVDIYPKPQYPRYALGLAYVLSLDLPKKLLEASRHVKAIYIEDVYLGLCMEYLNIPPTDPPNWDYFQVFPVPYNRCSYSRLVATTLDNNTDLLWVWKDFNQAGKSC